MTCRGCGDREGNESGYCSLCQQIWDEMCLVRNRQQEDDERAEAQEQEPKIERNRKCQQ